MKRSTTIASFRLQLSTKVVQAESQHSMHSRYVYTAKTSTSLWLLTSSIRSLRLRPQNFARNETTRNSQESQVTGSRTRHTIISRGEAYRNMDGPCRHCGRSPGRRQHLYFETNKKGTIRQKRNYQELSRKPSHGISYTTHYKFAWGGISEHGWSMPPLWSITGSSPAPLLRNQQGHKYFVSSRQHNTKNKISNTNQHRSNTNTN
jgi:hypothetical protein